VGEKARYPPRHFPDGTAFNRKPLLPFGFAVYFHPDNPYKKQLNFFRAEAREKF